MFDTAAELAVYGQKRSRQTQRKKDKCAASSLKVQNGKTNLLFQGQEFNAGLKMR